MNGDNDTLSRGIDGKRRATLRRLGLLALAAYSAPALLHLSQARAHGSGGNSGPGGGSGGNSGPGGSGGPSQAHTRTQGRTRTRTRSRGNSSIPAT